MSQQEVLAKLGLTEKDQKTYITLLAMGQLSDGELAKFSGLALREVTESLVHLKEKGLAHEIEGITAKWVAAYPFAGMSESIGGLKSDLGTISTDLDAVLKSRVAEYKSYAEHVRKELEEKLDRTKQSLKIRTETMKEDFEKFTGLLTDKTNEELRTEESSLLQQIESTTDAEKQQISTIRSQACEVVEEATESVGAAGAVGSEQVQKHADQIKTSLLSVVDEFETTTRTSATTHLDRATTVLEQGRAALNDALTSSLQECNTAIGEIRSNIETVATEQSRALTGVGTTIKADTMTFADQRHSEIQIRLDSIRNQTAAILEENTTQLRERAGQIQMKLNADANQALTQLRRDATTIIEDLESKATEITHELDTTTAQLLQTFKETISTGVEEFNTALQHQRTLFAGNIDTTLQSFDTSVTNTTQEFSTGLSTTVAAIDAQSKEAVDRIIAEQTHIIDDETTRFKENIETTIHKGIEQTDQLAVKFREESNSLLTGASDEVQEIIDSTKSSISQLAEQIRQSHNQTITDQLGHLSTAVTEQKETVETSIADLQNGLNATLTECTSKIETTNQNFQQTVDTLVAKRLTDLETVQKKIAETIQHATAQMTEKIQMNASSLQTKAIDTVNGNWSAATEAIDSVQTTIKAGVKEQIDTLITKLQDFSGKFAGNVREVAHIVGTTETSLSALWDIVQSYERKPVFTAVLLGKESILAYMEKMLTEVKSTITLVAPSYQFLRDMVDTLKAVKSAARVTILTTVDPAIPAERDFICGLYQKDNIRVRTIQREEIEYWGADRDAEEVVLAPAETEYREEELVGVATQTKGFIDLLSKITIGAYLMARSKEISRSEVDM